MKMNWILRMKYAKEKSIYMIVFMLLPAMLFSQLTKEERQKRRQENKEKNANEFQPLLIRGPYLQVATTNSIVIRWRTDALCRSRVSYGTSLESLNKTVSDNKLVTEHEVKLTGLSARTKYYYSVGGLKDTLQQGNNNYFVTLPPAGKEDFYRIGVFGDCGTNSVNQKNVRDEFLKYLGDNYLDSWILLGDNAYPDGTDAEYQLNFFNVYKDNLLKKCPLFPAPGNHDYHDLDFSEKQAQRTHETVYYKSFSMPVNGESGGVASHSNRYYSYNVGNIHFLSLDSYGEEQNGNRLYDTLGEQVKWVKKDLTANTNKGWIVAYWHHPPYTMGTHNSDKETELVKIRENFIKVLERAGVDLILCGHSHNYERSKLMKGHYGNEASFSAEKYNISQSSGMYDGTATSCPYVKDAKNSTGIVYVVAGSAGKIGASQASFPHDAMPYSNAKITGAVMLEVQGNRLDLKWICSDGVIRDHFTMMKNVNKNNKVKVKLGQRVTLTASYIGNYKWSEGIEAGRSINVSPVRATTYTVEDPYSCIKDTFDVEVSK